ncbi:MAG: hypothetical protein A3E88_00465 [Legionellales bacterium RIFCSPHIGHO2_12_FULL_35_11]|nr:MAG: hypothetical protein A3E88_00465 [Legionellales bacterium RIFCSPHIGHO2_12_FULL_35_11]
MFELASPWTLLAIPIPFLIWFILPTTKPKMSVSLKVPFYKPLKEIIKNKKSKKMPSNNFLTFFIAYLFLLIALSGPRYIGEPQPLSLESCNILLALDISPSMGINDMQINGRRVTRLDAVKGAAKQFVLDRPSDKIGLILFGEQAYLLTPLTFDRQNILMRLDDASVGLAGKSTSTGDAIGLAIKKLEHVNKKGRMIVLLTDGASNSGMLHPIKSAEIARDEGIKIYTIGLHSEIDPNSFSGMFLSANSSADLDEDTLRSVAKITGGQYFRATNPQSLQKIYASIHKLSKINQDQKTIRPQHEYYPWFLGIGFILFLYAISKNSGLQFFKFSDEDKLAC